MRQAKGAGIIRSVVYQTVNGKAGEGWEIGRWGGHSPWPIPFIIHVQHYYTVLWGGRLYRVIDNCAMNQH